jgi:hypothetical protein
MAITWDTVNTQASLLLDDFSLTITSNNSGFHQASRANEGKETGKWYFEVSIDDIGSSLGCMIGLSIDGYGLSHYIGDDAYSYGYVAQTGKIMVNSSSDDYGDTYTKGDVVGVAFNADTGKLWFSKNGIWQNSGNPSGVNPATSITTSGKLYAAVSLYYSGTVLTGRFASDDFDYTIPDGYLAYEYVIPGVDCSGIGVDLLFTNTVVISIPIGVFGCSSTFRITGTVDNLVGSIDCSDISVLNGFTNSIFDTVFPGAIGVDTGTDIQLIIYILVADIGVNTSFDISDIFYLVGMADSSDIAITTGIIHSIFDTVLPGETGVNTSINTDVLSLVYISGVTVTTSVDASIFEFNSDFATAYYLFTLTGSDDETTDIEIPIKSFQGRLRSGPPSYLSVVIPYTAEYATAITARSNGDLQIDMAYKLDGEFIQRQELVWVHLEDIRIDQGGNNSSITLSGHRQETYTQKSVTLKDATYYRLSAGKKCYRFPKANMELNPGDTVTVGSDSLTADLITYTIGTMTQQMEVSEQ